MKLSLTEDTRRRLSSQIINDRNLFDITLDNHQLQQLTAGNS